MSEANLLTLPVECLQEILVHCDVKDLKQFSLCSWSCYEVSTGLLWESTSIHCRTIVKTDLLTSAQSLLTNLRHAKDLYLHADPDHKEVSETNNGIDDDTLHEYKTSDLSLPNFCCIMKGCDAHMLTTLWLSCLCFDDKRHDEYLAVVCDNLPMLRCLVLMSSFVTDVSLVNIATKLHYLDELHMYTEGKITDAGVSALVERMDLHALDLNGFLYYFGDNHNNTGGVLHSQVTDTAFEHLCRLKNLKHLDISLTNITDVTLLRVGKLDNLGLINVSETCITDTGVSHLKQLNNLHSLSMFGCKDIGDTALEHISGISALKFLDVGRTCITDDGVEHLDSLKMLLRLCIGYNFHITNDVVPIVKTFSRLVNVNVCFTSITATGFEELGELTCETMCNLHLPPQGGENDIEFDMSCVHLGTDFRFKLSEMSMDALLELPFLVQFINQVEEYDDEE